MSKIAEQKALEAYPEKWYRDCDGDSWDANEKLRKGYIVGYDQAMQDFLEKACEWLEKNSESYVRFDEVGYRFYAHISLIKDFKNYMQDEIQD